MAEEAEAKDPGGLDALDAQVVNVHAAAKWLIGAYAAVAALLVPGVGLADIGGLSDTRLLIAVALGLVALGAAVAAALQVAAVLSSPDPTIGELAAREKEQGDPLVAYLERNALLFQRRAKGPGDLVGKLEKARDRARLAEQADEAVPDGADESLRMRTKQIALARAADVIALEQVAESVEAVARYEGARQEFVRRSVPLVALTVLVAAALVGFAAAAHPPATGTSDFEGALVENVDLSGTNLEKAEFDGATLRGVDLTGANMDGADVDDADFEDTTCPNGKPADARTKLCSVVLPQRKHPTAGVAGEDLHAGR
jgi:hypothetical protein